VGIQPLGSFDKAMCDTLEKTISGIYGFQYILLPERQMPSGAFVSIKVPRYRADSLLKFLIRIKSDTIDYIIGLTEYDISTTKRNADGTIKEPAVKYSDWGIFGLGYCPGKACIVSTNRIKVSETKLFTQRFKKICIHELGHNLGLYHCPANKCVMQDAAETIKTIDLVELNFCTDCRRILAQFSR
jgi:archaemetzincin